VSTPGGTTTPYSFDSTVVTAGSYSLNLTDFGLPSPLTGVSAIVVQNGAVVGKPLTAAGSETLTAAAGPVSYLVFAQPATGGGLIDLNLTPSAGGAAVFDATQGIGQLFSSRQISVTTPGSYAVSVSDLSFPAPLATFAVIVTQGANQIGQVVGGGAFAFQATDGNYNLNFIAQPTDASSSSSGGTSTTADSFGAGTYALTVAPGPTVTLTSSATSVASGGTATLTWSSQNASTCTASGGWSGTQALSGTATTAAITAATTFTLTCTGTGVSVNQSVNLTIQAPASGGGGGGGKLSELLLLALLGALMVRPMGLRFGPHSPTWVPKQ
jgi:hypothetical protein